MYTSMNSTKKKRVLKVHKVPDGYVGIIHINDSKISEDIPVINIIDRSLSMGDNFKTTFNRIIPYAFLKMGYDQKTIMHNITFASESKYIPMSISDMYSEEITCHGDSTILSPAISILRDVLENKLGSDTARIFIISDGEVFDDDKDNVSKLVNGIKDDLIDDFNISCRGFRLITRNDSDPDTQAISNILQLDNTGDPTISTLPAKTSKSSDVAKAIITLFGSDRLNDSCVVSANSCSLKRYPWGKRFEKIKIFNGENIFWLDEDTDLDNLKIDIKGYDVVIKKCAPLVAKTFGKVMKNKIDTLTGRLKILKVIDTTDSMKEIDKIIEYFSNTMNKLGGDASVPSSVSVSGIANRVADLREKIRKRNNAFLLNMKKIANDDKVSELNQSQKASYLRTINNVTKNSKQLAKRALRCSTSYDEIARAEVRKMAEHIHEIEDICDDDHYKSFFNQDTTKGGIVELCSLVDDNDTIDELSVLDIIDMINIVGIPCRAIIGDFTDPMCYRVREIVSGSFASVSDILINLEQGSTLKTPYKDIVIDNIIPFFDDDRIHKFLLKYAPKLLEYVASVGMRRMIVEIPDTYLYTIAAGLWAMINTVTHHRSEVNVDVMMKMIHTYEIATGDMFNYVIPHLVDQDKKMMYFISNNGCTNMITPLLHLIRNEETKNIHRIMRSLYAFEIYLRTRRMFRCDNGDVKRRRFIDDILGMNYKLYVTDILPKMFEDNKAPAFHTGYVINDKMVSSIMDSGYYIKYSLMIPSILEATVADDGEKMKSMPKLTDEFMEDVLKIDYSIDRFTFYCVVQSLIYNDLSDRLDKVEDKMKIVDVGDQIEAEKMIAEYISKRYMASYRRQIADKGKLEHRTLAKELVKKMASTNDITEFINLFKNGYTKGCVTEIISGVGKLGYAYLRDALFNKDIDVPLRRRKILILLSGKTDSGDIVWNNGNSLNIHINKLKRLTDDLEMPVVWDDIMNLYKRDRSYLYRTINGEDKPNRHSHCNGKPSFFAFGFKTLEEYIKYTPEEDREEYFSVHKECCGVPRYLNGYKPRPK